MYSLFFRFEVEVGSVSLYNLGSFSYIIFRSFGSSILVHSFTFRLLEQESRPHTLHTHKKPITIPLLITDVQGCPAGLLRAVVVH